MEKGKTLIIAFEGIDGSGKSVQIRRTLEMIRKQGYRAAIKDFPVYSSFFGKEIGRLLSGEDAARADELDPKSMCLWYAMDRFQAFRDFDWKAYDVVLLNRSTLSNVVYQSIRLPEEKRDEMAHWILELEYGQLGIVKPDLFLVFDIDERLSAANVAGKGQRDYLNGKHDVYEQSKDMLFKSRCQYQMLAKEFPNIRLISCLDENGEMKAVDAITELVFQEIRKYWVVSSEL